MEAVDSDHYRVLPVDCCLLYTSAAIRSVEDTARSGENLMPRILAAVEANATVGEISDAMRKVYGEYKEAVVI